MAEHTDLQTTILGITEHDAMVYESGQRRCGPPQNWSNEAPAKGCEVFIAKIPKECSEKDLIPIMRQCGEIYLFRLMMENEDYHRGFGFCIYISLESARNAVAKLNNYQIRKNWYLGVCFSVDNCRLFVGGIPKLKIKHEIFNEMSKVTDNVVDIIVYPSAADKNKNRGFAFVEYTDHKSAAVARKKMIGNGIQLWGHNVAVDWAEPERKVDEETMSKVKILYIRNLMLTTSEDSIYKTCSKFTNEEDEIIRVKKIGDFAFVHFKNRSEAEIVKNNLHGTDLEGSIIEVHFAKPANKLEQQQKLLKKSNTTFKNLLPLALNDELRKLSIDSVNSKPITPKSHPAQENNNAQFKSYRNAAGRCSIKSKQMIKNIEQRDDMHFNNCAEILIFICQSNGWEGPLFTVQMIPMMAPNSDMTMQIFVAQAFIPGLNMSFPSKIGAFTQDDAIMSASECALQCLFYNGMQIPPLMGQSKTSSPFTNDKDENTVQKNEISPAALNYGHPSELTMSNNITNQNQPQYIAQLMQYGPYYSNPGMQHVNLYQLGDNPKEISAESSKMPIPYMTNEAK